MKKQLKMLTVMLAIETDSDDMDAIEAAVCSNLADLSIDYDCFDDSLDGEERTMVEGRIAIANTEHCRVDSGVTVGYAHPSIGNTTRRLGDRQFVFNMPNAGNQR